MSRKGNVKCHGRGPGARWTRNDTTLKRGPISEGLPSLYLLFKQAGVPTDLHVYAGAGHGFGIRDGDKSPAGTWPARFREWLDDRGFLGKK